MCAAVSDPPLIAGRFVVDLEQPVPGAGGGLDAFVATDKTSALGSLIALKVHRRFPARAQALHALSTPVDGILNPIARGTGFTRNGEGALFLITPSPPGPPIGGAARAWGEAELLDRVPAPRRPNSRQACCTRPDPSRDPPRECLCCSRGCHARLRLGRSTGHAPAIGVRISRKCDVRASGPG